MAEIKIKPLDSVVEEREAELVSFNNPQQPIKLKGLFLNPTSSSSSSDSPIDPIFNPANFPLIRRTPAYDSEFRWWADPQSQWPNWVNKLMPRYKNIWLKAGIFHAIIASTIKIRRDPNSLLGLARFWCQETNTFIFPWAEATLTLEDVMILGKFSVVGEPVRMNEPLGGVVRYFANKMMWEIDDFKRKVLERVEQPMWMKHYMEVGKGDEIEHIAFLLLWLSRFVLIAANGKCIRESAIQVAVRLARGTRIALAPAVLASIYRDLRVMKEHISTSASAAPLLAVWSPLNVLQVWVWERFPALKPDSKILTSPDMPRVARWNMTGKMHKAMTIMRVIESPDEFQWRPYEVELHNWCRPSFYTKEGGWFSSGAIQDEGLRSFVRCLRACELVGLDCIEQYQPHRVAMQFALDQDIPKSLPRVNDTWEAAWKTYDIGVKNVKFYVPALHFKSQVTLQYSNWWRSAKKKDVQVGEKRKGTQPLVNSKKKKKRKKKKPKGLNETKPSAPPVLKPHEFGSSENVRSEPQQQQACESKQLQTELKLPVESSEAMKEDSDIARESKTMEEQLREDIGAALINKDGTEEVVHQSKATDLKVEFRTEGLCADEEGTVKKTDEQQNEELRPEELCVDEEGTMITTDEQQKEELGPAFGREGGITEGALQTNADEPRGQKAIEKSEEENEKQSEGTMKTVAGELNNDQTVGGETESEHKTEDAQELEVRDPIKKKELERDRQINRLKEEIASLMQQIRYWESLAKVPCPL